MKKYLPILLLWLIIFLGVFLRAYKMDLYPTNGNDDSIFYAWSGVSFWKNPLQLTSHSIFDADNQALVWRSQFKDYLPDQRFGMKIVRPWFDHPPLATVFIGLPSLFLGYTGVEQIPSIIIRHPVIVASIFTLLFTFLLAQELFGKKTAYLSLIILATVPYFVFAHRQAFLENILVPFFLASLYFFYKKKYGWALLLAALLPWFKIPGLGVILMMGAWLLKEKQSKLGWTYMATGLLSFVSYLIYGLASNSHIFLQTIGHQGVRGAFVSSLRDIISMPHFYDGIKDGWYLLGYLALFSLLFLNTKNKKILFFNWFAVTWLVVLFLLSGPNNNSPWYYYPLLPLMSMALGYRLKIFMETRSLIYAVIFWVLGLTGLDLLGISLSSNILRLSTMIFFLPLGLNLIWGNIYLKKLSRFWVLIFVSLLILLNVYTSLKFVSKYCTQHECYPAQKIVM